ncbi:MAG: TonB family protein [Nitrospirales bacterium]|nr:TonB family protein [Nitrospirales bacterium]
MGHAESPSLISLGLATDVSQESSSFRWGLVTSGLFHAVIIMMALFLRFQSTVEEPLRAIDVTLISLPEAQAPVPSQKKSSPRTPPPQKSQPPKAEPTKTQPIEAPLPPLPVPKSSERLSEFLGGAVDSIVVPHKQEMAAPPPSPQINEQPPLNDQSPLLENLRMPPIAPQISRPERLQLSQPLVIPKPAPAPSPKETAPLTTVPPDPQGSESQPQLPKIEPTVKLAPVLPELSSVTPFRASRKERKPNDASPSNNIEESLKRSIPTVPVPAPTPKIKKQPKASTPQPEKPFVPEISAPPLAQIFPSPPKKNLPQREKMSDMMKQLMEEATAPNLKLSPASPAPQQPVSSASSLTKPVQSEIDQRIAKLSIPDVTPVESIKNRLQLLEVQPTSDSRNSAAQSSTGTNHYYGMIQDLIQDQWRRTPLVADAPLVVLKFRIFQSGEISQIRIDKSSGNGYYDSAAQRAVNAVNPLPPFPPDISDSFLDVRFQFIKTDQKD